MANEIIKGMGFHHIALRCADIEKSLTMYKALGIQAPAIAATLGDGHTVFVNIFCGSKVCAFFKPTHWWIMIF